VAKRQKKEDAEVERMEIIITLRDDDDGQVQIEEVRQLALGETEESVTVASALAEEMLAVVEELGEAGALAVMEE
jgi:hypothetical protein